MNGSESSVRLLLVLLAWASASGLTSAQELPLVDLHDLGLRVVRAETMGSISDGIQTVLRPRGGARLAIVTLRGVARKPCRIAFEAREFAAVFEARERGADGSSHAAVQVQLSSAAAEGNGGWVMLPVGAADAVATSPIRKAGPVTLRVAFTLPQQVTTFQVRFPALAGGRAQLGGGSSTVRRP